MNSKIIYADKVKTDHFWYGEQSSVVLEPENLRSSLLKLNQPFWVVQKNDEIGVAVGGNISNKKDNGTASYELLGQLPSVPIEALGDTEFCSTYGTRYAYMTGAMANGIASERLVIAIGKAGMLGSFGSAGLPPTRIEAAIAEIQSVLGVGGSYSFNLINSPSDPAAERRTAELLVQHKVPTIEASAYVDMTVPLVFYRVSGLTETPDGKILTNHKVIGKVSRREVAALFLSPAPEDILTRLVAEGKITSRQAELARHVSMADDITVEADSGGHTDNRPLVSMFPGMIALRNEFQEKYGYPTTVRLGAGGGISTPESALAAFMMGAAYIVTGSVNQACLEAATSEHTRKLLATAEMADIAMAPASDMFEMGVRVQVLKRGTLFPIRAQKLWEIYDTFEKWEDVPKTEREKLEKTVFKRSFEEIWNGTEQFFEERDPRQNERARKDPHHKMALVFRWYLGLSSRWSNSGEKGREMDYQIWCGAAMGAFNDWVRGTYLEDPDSRRAVDVAFHILTGAAYLSRQRIYNLYGGRLPSLKASYIPHEALI